MRLSCGSGLAVQASSSWAATTAVFQPLVGELTARHREVLLLGADGGNVTLQCDRVAMLVDGVLSARHDGPISVVVLQFEMITESELQSVLRLKEAFKEADVCAVPLFVWVPKNKV